VSVIAEMRNRTRAMAAFLVAKAHASATLAALRSAGATHVDLVPERVRRQVVGDGEGPGHPFRGNQYTSGAFSAAPSPEAFIAARNKSTRLAYLSPTTPEELKSHRLLMNENHTAGVAVSPEGDIQNVFNNGGPKGAGVRAVAAAVDAGGRTLDCYDNFLNGLYGQLGFKETGRMTFNREFAHNYPGKDEPDVVFMAWKGWPAEGREAAIARAQNRDRWNEVERAERRETDWDEAKQRSRSLALHGGGARDHQGHAAGSSQQGMDARSDSRWPRTGTGDRRAVDASGKQGPGSRGGTSARTVRRIKAVSRKLRQALLGRVDVLTAGDDLVCERCLEVSENGPYTLSQAEGLIPLHNFCRCSFVRAGKYEKDYDPDQPRAASAPGHSGGEFASYGAGIEAITSPTPGRLKKKVKAEDFNKGDMNLSYTSDREQFLKTWDEKVGMEPEQFKNEFLGGMKGTMGVSARGNRIEFTGNLVSESGSPIAQYTRSIDFDDNEAHSDYFKIVGSRQHADIGKTMLAANVEMYQKLGLDKVNVHANIDVGGYAWAKYGYVPRAGSWDELSGKIERRLGGGGGGRGSGEYPDSWEEMSNDQQDEIEHQWRRETAQE
jgi:hypothetical protein